MKISKEIEEKIAQLQLLEQNLQSFLLQKQTFQTQLLEIENALEELNKANTAYKIIGPIMISSNKEELKRDLNSKREVLKLRIKNLEKQEARIKEKASQMQSDVMKTLNK